MRKKKTYGFADKEVAEQLRQMVGGGDSLLNGKLGSQPAYIAQTPSGGIAARSGSTVSSANCTIYAINGTSLTSASITLPVFNLSTSAVAENAYIICLFAGGALVCNWEDC